MQRIKPVLDGGTNTERLLPKVPKVDDEKEWTFTFRFFRQIEYFGLDGADTSPAWFASLFERFSDLSQRKLSEFLADRAIQGRSGYRFHPINWSQKNIPIQRKDLNWIPSDYLDNEAEYPIFQFQISKANGRIIGFFDEHWNFNILMLDPMHNIQPSRDYGYKVDQCSPLSCEYTALQASMEFVTNGSCDAPTCGYRNNVEILDTVYLPTNAIIHYMDDDLADVAQSHIDSGKADSFTDIFESGIIYLNE